ncbi:MAG: DUF3048 domain-containing protein [Candidatus Magasanikbacteria bacterium]
MKEKIFGYIKNNFGIDEVKYLYILAGIVCVVAIGLAGFFGYGVFKNRVSGIGNEGAGLDLPVQAGAENKACKFQRMLDGVCVDSQDKVNPKLVAVMIENHPDARPQSGLSQASIVYEAPVESNYTRFMAIYPVGAEGAGRDLPVLSKVGPVRSARPYYLDWVSEHDNIMYMHCGGSPDALEVIDEYGIFDFNEFYKGGYFWRSQDRYAPHNVYTSSELWNKGWEDYGEVGLGNQKLDVTSTVWKFEEREKCTTDCVSEFTVSFLPPTYEATWKFNSSTDKYERYQSGMPHADQDGTLITADNVVVIYVKTKVLDSIGRIDMETIGEGEAVVFRDGYQIPAQWYKGSKEEKLQLRDVDFHEMIYKPGKTWVEVVNQLGKVETSN